MAASGRCWLLRDYIRAHVPTAVTGLTRYRIQRSVPWPVRDRPRVRVVYQQTGAAAPRSRGMRYAYLALLGPPYTSPLQTMLQNDERLNS